MKITALLGMMSLLLLLPLSATATDQQTSRSHSASRKGLFAHPSIEQAWESAVEEQKLLLVMFETKHCAYCRKMLSETYGNSAVQQMLAKDTETVLASAADYRPLIKRMGIRGFPTTLLVSPQGEVLDLMEGYVDAKAFAKRMAPHLARQATRVGNASAAFIEPLTVDR